MQDKHECFLKNHAKTLEEYSKMHEVQKINTELNFKKSLKDYNRKITSLRHQ